MATFGVRALQRDFVVECAAWELDSKVQLLISKMISEAAKVPKDIWKNQQDDPWVDWYEDATYSGRYIITKLLAAKDFPDKVVFSIRLNTIQI